MSLQLSVIVLIWLTAQFFQFAQPLSFSFSVYAVKTHTVNTHIKNSKLKNFQKYHNTSHESPLARWQSIWFLSLLQRKVTYGRSSPSSMQDVSSREPSLVALIASTSLLQLSVRAFALVTRRSQVQLLLGELRLSFRIVCVIDLKNHLSQVSLIYTRTTLYNSLLLFQHVANNHGFFFADIYCI